MRLRLAGQMPAGGGEVGRARAGLVDVEAVLAFGQALENGHEQHAVGRFGQRDRSHVLALGIPQARRLRARRRGDEHDEGERRQPESEDDRL